MSPQTNFRSDPITLNTHEACHMQEHAELQARCVCCMHIVVIKYFIRSLIHLLMACVSQSCTVHKRSCTLDRQKQKLEGPRRLPRSDWSFPCPGRFPSLERVSMRNGPARPIVSSSGLDPSEKKPSSTLQPAKCSGRPLVDSDSSKPWSAT